MRIYFSGIAGVGIGSLAEVAQDAGHDVLGSDPVDSLTSRELRSRGIPIRSQQDAAGLLALHAEQPIDWFVHTAALPDDHPELLAARSAGMRVGKRDELLRRLLSQHDLRLVAVSGSHGKTTTTGLLIWMLQQLGVPISWSIGTTLTFGSSGAYEPGSRWFVYECDEFDRNLLHFDPDLALIPSLTYDHPDSYPTPQHYRDTFRQFALQSGHVIGWADQQGEVFHGVPGTELLDASATDESLALPGRHLRRNAVLAMHGVRWILDTLGLPADEHALRAAAESFPGTDRRFETLAPRLVSDYGHHPNEIRATLQLARELTDRVVLVYQPHQNVRQHELLGHYGDEFDLAERVYWLPTYLSRENPALRILSPAELSKTVEGTDVRLAEWGPELWAELEALRADGALILAMGAGTIDGWVRDALDGRFG